MKRAALAAVGLYGLYLVASYRSHQRWLEQLLEEHRAVGVAVRTRLYSNGAPRSVPGSVGG